MTLIAASPIIPASPLWAADDDPTVQEVYNAAQSGHLNQAQNMIDRVLRSHPESAKAHYVRAQLYASQGNPDLARSELARAEQLDPGLPDISLQSVHKLKTELGVAGEKIVLRREAGTYVLPVAINDRITLDFTLDTGATDVCIPADVAMTLIRTKTLTREDFLGHEVYQLADGSTLPSPLVRIHTLRIGNIEMKDIVASIVPPNGTLLLGQSFLGRLPSWTIDNHQPALIIGDTTAPAEPDDHNEIHPRDDVTPSLPHANVSDYQLQQSAIGISPKKSGTLRVQASILNDTRKSVPYPLLRVSLLDRSGKRIWERVVGPPEYLGKARPGFFSSSKWSDSGL